MHISIDHDDDDSTHAAFDPVINASRLQTPSSSTTDKRTASEHQYRPDRCTVCSLTQKEAHQQMKTMHDPCNPDQCCFRGPKFIEDKHIRESIMQYNLKHPGPPNPSTPETKVTPPPQPATIPSPQMNSAKIDPPTKN